VTPRIPREFEKSQPKVSPEHIESPMGEIDHLHQTKDEGEPRSNDDIHESQGQTVQELLKGYLDRHLWKDLVEDKPDQPNAYPCQNEYVDESLFVF